MNNFEAFAADHGFDYTPNGDLTSIPSIEFTKRGSDHKITDVVSGLIDGLPFRIFQFWFTIYDRQRAVTGSIMIIEIGFGVDVPPLITRSHNFIESFAISPPFGYHWLHLEGQFDQRYRLFVVPGVENPALEIYSPDTMEWLFDRLRYFDTQLAGTSLYISQSELAPHQTIDDAYKFAAAFGSRLAPVINRMNFEPGNSAEVLAATKVKTVITNIFIVLGLIIVVGGGLWLLMALTGGT
ncbi:hypothetical protein HJC99_06830 [Candidatus Saccharibacteria bacterium]|nr:hypothetical protein [Candidatus Saccharibacteria bacterium]